MGSIQGNNTMKNQQYHSKQEQVVNKQADYLNTTMSERYDELIKCNPYVTQLDKAPLFATLYHQDKEASVVSTALGSTHDNIGMSGKVYDEIKNVPLFNMNKSEFQKEMDELGLKASFKTEAIMPPDVVDVFEEDFLTLNYQNHTYLFKITEVQISNIENVNYYRISFKLHKRFEDDFNVNKQIRDKYTTIYENIGTDNKAVILDDDYELLLKYNHIYGVISEAYLSTFYVPQACTLLCNDIYSHRHYYDPYLVEFVARNKLFETDHDYNSTVIIHLQETERDFLKRYKKSIYYNYLKQKPFENRIKEVPMSDYCTLSNYFRWNEIPYTAVLLYGGNPEPPTFYTKLHHEFSYTEEYTGTCEVYSLIQKFFDDEDFNDDLFELEDFYCDCTVDNFVGVPMLLNLIKNKKDNITINKVKGEYRHA